MEKSEPQTREWSRSHNQEVLENLPCNRAQTLHLFVQSKKHLAGRRFAEDADVKQAVTSWLHALDTHFFYVMILPLVVLWDTWLNVKGDNVEDWCLQSDTRILYVQNKLLGIRVFVITVFEFIVIGREERDKEYENEEYTSLR